MFTIKEKCHRSLGSSFPFLIGKLRIILCQQLNWEQRLLLWSICDLISNFCTLLYLKTVIEEVVMSVVVTCVREE